MDIQDTDVVILCGGLGKRLKSVVGDTQKVMAEVNGQPFLDLLIDHIKKQGASRIILCTGYKAQELESYYRDKFDDIVIDFSREDEPLGTGGALKNAREIITSDPFFVLNGDSLCLVDLPALLKSHNENQALATIVVVPSEENEDFGGIVLDDQHRIESFKEKSTTEKTSFINAGVYCFDQKIFENMPSKASFLLEFDVFPNIVGNQFFGFKLDKKFYDIGTPERYSQAQVQLKEGS